jgi:hypothetical protein
MRNSFWLVTFASSFLGCGLGVHANAAPRTVETTVLGPWIGEGAPLHPANRAPHAIRYYGTDLGFTYEHAGELQILFGDTMATESGEPVEAQSGTRLDDSFGTIDFPRDADPRAIEPGHLPPVRLGQHAGSVEAIAIDIGQPLEGFKTPVGGFSNGEREFGLFYASKPQVCRNDADCGSNGFVCDSGLGYVGAAATDPAGITFACVEGAPGCTAETADDPHEDYAASGFCVDPGTSVRGVTPAGRAAATALQLLIGTRSQDAPGRYSIEREWLTNRFSNVALRTVQSFDPRARADHDSQQFQPATRSRNGARVFLWGRPAFVGVNAKGRSLSQYFAYVDLPARTDFEWRPHYFSGVDANGIAQWSDRETDAAALDLDAHESGIQSAEPYDVVNQVSVAWVEPLRKWVMLYGGGVSTLTYAPQLPNCGVLELFAGTECTAVEIGDGAFHMRTADAPWGPWSPPQDLIRGGDPALVGSGQYGSGGMLRHALCTAADCAPHTDARDVHADEYGFFYSANLISEWTRAVDGGVEILWNASTWDPYRVILLRTRIMR